MRPVVYSLLLAFMTPLALVADEPRPAISGITLERTGCYGPCPSYKVTVHSDGTVEYEGIKYVKEKGTRKGKITEAEFRTLADKTEAIGFFKLKDLYDQEQNPDGSITTVTDLPTRITTVTKDNHSRTVKNYFGGPKGLEELEGLIDEVTKSSVWIVGQPPEKP